MTGFVNQSQLPPYYLATDIAILPSQQMGETWGLVVNEALQAGNAVCISDAVGCSVEFSGWERVRVFPSNNANALTQALESLLKYPHNFDWCQQQMQAYSVDATAHGYLKLLDKLS